MPKVNLAQVPVEENPPSPSGRFPLSGPGKFRTPQGSTELTSGDAIFCAPGEPHQTINDGIEERSFKHIGRNTHNPP
jgi:quercetin dioxygenase-like cupin family protein